MTTHRVTHYLYSLNGVRADKVSEQDFRDQMILYVAYRDGTLIEGSHRFGDLQGEPVWICEFDVDDHRPPERKLTVQTHRRRRAERSFDPTEELIDSIDDRDGDPEC